MLRLAEDSLLSYYLTVLASHGRITIKTILTSWIVQVGQAGRVDGEDEADYQAYYSSGAKYKECTL